MLMGYTNSEDLCLACVTDEETDNILREDVSESDVKIWSIEIENINKKRLTLHKGYPPKVAQSFSLALDYCHQAELNAKTIGDIWKAKVLLVKLKAV